MEKIFSKNFCKGKIPLNAINNTITTIALQYTRVEVETYICLQNSRIRDEG